MSKELTQLLEDGFKLISRPNGYAGRFEVYARGDEKVIYDKLDKTFINKKDNYTTKNKEGNFLDRAREAGL